MKIFVWQGVYGAAAVRELESREPHRLTSGLARLEP